MNLSPTRPTSRVDVPWRTWLRALLLVVGVAASAAVGYVVAVAVMIVAILIDAAPLLAGQSTPQQPWVTPVAVGAGAIVFGLGVWLSVKTCWRRSATV